MEENLPVNPLEFGLSQGRAWEAMELLCLCLWLVSQHKADAKAAALHLFRFECHAMLCCWFCLNCDLWQCCLPGTVHSRCVNASWQVINSFFY